VDEVVTPLEAPYARHVYHIYAIRVQERDEVMWLLKEKGIQCGVHYPVPVHLQKAYRSLGYEAGALPTSEQTALEFISLPMFPELTEEQIGMVGLSVREAVANGVMV
jgi:dTDP-4-amino-4,6-dideoxygalactose transaminase